MTFQKRQTIVKKKWLESNDENFLYLDCGSSYTNIHNCKIHQPVHIIGESSFVQMISINLGEGNFTNQI